MKVSDIMHTSVVSVSPSTSIKEAARIIFELSFSGIPVIENEKIIGMVTESDILRRMQPTIADIVEDFKHATNFIEMEKNLNEILNSPVSSIMTEEFKFISPDEPIMKAQSIMFLNNFSRLPVVDKHKKILGIISQGDIFRELIKNEIPKAEQERYAEFVAKYYDLMVNWEKRFDYELPVLFRQFQKLQAKSVIDLGIWTGEYSINLIKEGIPKVLGIDHNKSMIELSKKKISKLSKREQERIEIHLTDFTNLEDLVKQPYDVAICMGNSLPYIPLHFPELLKQVKNVLRKENGAIILQVLNHEKLLKSQNRLLSFQIQKDQDGEKKEHLFLEFFDTTNDKNKIIHHLVIFTKVSTNWSFRGVTSIPIFYYTEEYLEEELVKQGFKRIIVSGNNGEYQGEYGQLSFHNKFDPETSDWMNIVAVRR